jgi:3-methyl-2-oxobutanoate hydroxymethyltransferase
LSFRPKFVKRYATLEEVAVDALQRYAEEVRGGVFPGPEHGFGAKRSGKIARLY